MSVATVRISDIQVVFRATDIGVSRVSMITSRLAISGVSLLVSLLVSFLVAILVTILVTILLTLGIILMAFWWRFRCHNVPVSRWQNKQ